jgi:hypothetical protein
MGVSRENMQSSPGIARPPRAPQRGPYTLRRLALAVALAIGAGFAWGVGSALLLALLEHLFLPAAGSEGFSVLRSGTPVLERYGEGPGGASRYRTLDGRPISVPSGGNAFALFVDFDAPNTSRTGLGNDWRVRKIQAENSEQDTIWYFVHDGRQHGHGYFAGYDVRSKRPIGWIGRAKPPSPPGGENFPAAGGHAVQEPAPQSSDPPADLQFDVDGGMVQSRVVFERPFGDPSQHGGADRTEGNPWQVYLLANDGLWGIDLRNQVARLIFPMRHTVSGGRIAERDNYGRWAKPPRLLLRDLEQIHVLDSPGKEICSYRIPAGLRRESFKLYDLGNSRVLLAEFEYSWQGGESEELYWFDAPGNVAGHQSVPRETPWLRRAFDPYFTTVTVPSPMLWNIGVVLYCFERMGRSETLGFPTALGEELFEDWPQLLVVYGVSAVLAVLAYRRQRRYGLEWPWVWVAMVFLFGVPMYLAYLAHRDWPARIGCRACRQPAPRDREDCLVCGEPFALPAAKGIEVFA